MAVAAWLVWREPAVHISSVALGFYIVQLLLNAYWSWVFSGLHRISPALADLVVFWILVAVTTILLGKARPVAGLLLIPYVAWVVFAGFLNGALWNSSIIIPLSLASGIWVGAQGAEFMMRMGRFELYLPELWSRWSLLGYMALLVMHLWGTFHSSETAREYVKRLLTGESDHRRMGGRLP